MCLSVRLYFLSVDNEYVSLIFKKLGICIDTVVMCLGELMGKFQYLIELSL